MRTLLTEWKTTIVWVLFFATTVYGHVALKLAVHESPQVGLRKVIQAGISPWGGSALLAWMASAFLWAAVLAGHSLLTANAIASLRFIFIGLGAWVFLHERLSPSQLAGALMITAGIWLLSR